MGLLIEPSVPAFVFFDRGEWDQSQLPFAKSRAFQEDAQYEFPGKSDTSTNLILRGFSCPYTRRLPNTTENEALRFLRRCSADFDAI
jgi:hypothetical protein